ncbi:uncharacterized protein LOC124363391 [Homalodisca vitripennis]|uniref:uncharacterized protein LOC124363391 n=1 Tax=Homalodisca vitripennis TaxID=197043 RepID=UPI001EEA517F|nr:uncharacterized protein LOC124363391 [Homalodisca vitripennis]
MWWTKVGFLNVSDCLHLQLYRDSKDRYKQGQTKASLSLQHFLGVHSGFTLDKESNTIAIICQDVTVVLAFDTRERLIQWQVKIANNLGEDEQFLVQIQSAPARGKIPPGPARLHIQERQFCMTVGVPPRLVGYWQIGQLRRYGVVENRFCFEGGSRCGRGEGLYVLVSDQGKDISRAFQLAAEGKLYSRKRHHTKNALDSPKKRVEADLCGASGLEDAVAWPSCETRPDCDYADTASVTDTSDTYHQETGIWTTETSMERCMSCISKLGAMSRSSTMVQTPGSGFTPAWTMETNNPGGCPVPASTSSDDTRNTSTDSWSQPGMSTAIPTVSERCQCPPPSKFPNPLLPLESNVSSPQRKKLKPPMPLPSSCTCHHVSTYGDYDIPKPFQLAGRPNNETSGSPTDELYDTPKQLKERMLGEYGNYDVPQPANSCSCPQHGNTTVRVLERERDEWRRTACPCHRVMSWMSLPLPYCRRGYGRENTAPTQKVKLSGEGKMPIANSNSSIPIYATIDRSKKTKCRIAQAMSQNSDNCNANRSENIAVTSEELKLDEVILSTNYANIESTGNNLPLNTLDKSGNTTNSPMYMNFEFAQSLEYYENSKDVLKRARQINDKGEQTHESKQPQTVLRNGEKYCVKCGHASKRDPHKPPEKQDDYLLMEPSAKEDSGQMVNGKNSNPAVKHFPGYLPMHPVPSTGGISKTELLEYNFSCRRSLLSERAASSPSLCGPVVDRSKKHVETNLGNSRFSAHNVNHSISATSSPYLRRRLLNSLGNIGDEEPRYNSALLRKRSNSADSARYLDDLESITERTVSSSPTQINVESSKNTSMDSLCSQSLSIKRLNDVSLSNGSSFSNIPPCTDETQNVEKDIDEVPYEKPEPAKQEIVVDARFSVRDTADHPGLTVHIRRSSSVPCKSGHNRDSSSSNDSGVSIGSLKQRGSDFAEFELPLTTSMSTRRHHHALSQHLNAHHIDCFHASLPRRSKSSDPLRELSFQFQDIKITPKSSSAEAEVPICLIKKDAKGYLSPGSAMPYIDSHSTSSGTSDMSDYIETLSLSSYSSSDTPESLRFSRTAATTLRPRSGKEYHKIDRYFLDSDMKKPPYIPIPPVVENSESTSFLDTK